MLTAIVTIDIAHNIKDDEPFDLGRADRHALWGLDQMPDGAELRVRVGNRSILMPDSIEVLARHSRRLCIKIDAADATTARRWLDAIRNGDLW